MGDARGGMLIINNELNSINNFASLIIGGLQNCLSSAWATHGGVKATRDINFQANIQRLLCAFDKPISARRHVKLKPISGALLFYHKSFVAWIQSTSAFGEINISKRKHSTHLVTSFLSPLPFPERDCVRKYLLSETFFPSRNELVQHFRSTIWEKRDLINIPKVNSSISPTMFLI